MKICLNSDELHALYGLPHTVICLYIMAIRPRMDFITGLVGIRPRISWHALSEWVYVEPWPGIAEYRPSRWAVMRAAWQLERAGLLRLASIKKQLIFECVLASRDKSVQNKAATRPQGQPARSQPSTGAGFTGKAARPSNVKAATHPKSLKPSSSITTTTTGNSIGGGGAKAKNEAPRDRALIWPRQLSDLEKTAALASMLDPRPRLSDDVAQLVLDELGGQLNGGKVRNPLQYLGKLVKLARAGRFFPELAHQVRAKRERAAASAAAVVMARAQYLAGVEQQPTRPMTPDEIDRLPEPIRRTLRKRNGTG